MQGVVTRKSYGSHAKPLLLGALALAFLAYAAFAVPTITFVSPLQDNSTFGSNWTYVNITSSTEDLNQSILVWGNSTGFWNVTMSNLSASMRNWYKNMSNLTDGIYNYTVLAQNTTGSWNQSVMRFVTIDTVPPMSVTNLANQSQDTTWIYWNWTNPADSGSGFNHTEVWLNGTFQQNASVNYFNATGLSANNSYQIQTRTVDNAGNINTTWVNSTAKTLPDTTPPTISFVSPTWDSGATRPETWAYINITLNKNGSASVLNWTNSTGSWNFTMTNASATPAKNWYINMTGGQNGTITYRVYANDTYGNMNVSEARTLTLNFTNYPQYSAASVGVNSTERNSSALFSANWTDVAGLAGYIFSTNNNGTWVNSSWTAFTGVSNTSTFTISKLNDTRTAVVGYIFYANNTYGRWNYTNSTLTIQCTESWSCTSWSSCSSGSQTRTCSDVNACGTLVNIPPQTQSCTYTDNSTSSSSSGTPTATQSFAVFPNDIVTKVKVNLKLGLTSPSVAVSMLTTVPVSAPPEKVYQYLNITKTNFIDVNIDNATIEFSVSTSWMSSNNVTNVSLARYDGTNWNKLKTDFVSSASDTNKYVAYTAAFSYFAILGEKASMAPAAQPDAGNSTVNLSSSSSAQSNETSNNSTTLGNKPKTGSSIFSAWTIVGIALAVLLSAAAYIISKKGVSGLSGLWPKKEGGVPGKNNAPPPWSIPTERKPELLKKAAPSPVPIDNDEERRKKTFYSYQGS